MPGISVHGVDDDLAEPATVAASCSKNAYAQSGQALARPGQPQADPGIRGFGQAFELQQPITRPRHRHTGGGRPVPRMNAKTDV